MNNTHRCSFFFNTDALRKTRIPRRIFLEPLLSRLRSFTTTATENHTHLSRATVARVAAFNQHQGGGGRRRCSDIGWDIGLLIAHDDGMAYESNVLSQCCNNMYDIVVHSFIDLNRSAFRFITLTITSFGRPPQSSGFACLPIGLVHVTPTQARLFSIL